MDQLENDNPRLERRLAKLKGDNDRLRQQLDEARRQPHRQAGHFRRSTLKRRKKTSEKQPSPRQRNRLNFFRILLQFAPQSITLLLRRKWRDASQ
jgi:hypothetical protein